MPNSTAKTTNRVSNFTKYLGADRVPVSIGGGKAGQAGVFGVLVDEAPSPAPDPFEAPSDLEALSDLEPPSEGGALVAVAVELESPEPLVEAPLSAEDFEASFGRLSFL
jgi:hypothetical protein